ncbi:DUF6328 family protein [Microvirga sp. 2MCAF38]|uniref:DUF6328 family protein n=1 Tax=Microvirga sp. 2MCAF38 TaxID=3232989 RepID=UPI003F982CB5
MNQVKEKVRSALSEVRNLVLGAEILLGFQYQVLFQPLFVKLPSWAISLNTIAFFNMIVSIACLIAPTPFHRIAENGEASRRQFQFTWKAAIAGLLPFSIAVGASTAVATSLLLGTNALYLGFAVGGVTIFFWFGIEVMSRPTSSQTAMEPEIEKVSIREKVDALLSESRIILPGVQALLGFQLAAYLTSAFETLSGRAQFVHTVSLLALLLSMVLLMTPASYHRLVERGNATRRFEKVGSRLVLMSLVPLAIALAGDFFVVVETVTHQSKWALAGALSLLSGILGLWFAVPLIFRKLRDTQ